MIKEIIPNLSDRKHPYNTHHVAAIHTLADSKDTILLCDMDDCETLALELLAGLFDVSGGMEDSPEECIVRADMVEIMACLVEEVLNPISSKVFDIITAQFLSVVPFGRLAAGSGHNAAQTDPLIKTEPVPYTMAKQLYIRCQDTLAQPLGTHFDRLVQDALKIKCDSVTSPESESDNDGAHDTVVPPL